LAADERIDLSNVPLIKTVTPLNHTKDARFNLIATQITLENIDRVNLPPGFPPEPPKPVFREGGSEEEYKEYMKTRYKYEEWENSLLVWHHKHALNQV